MASSYRDTTVPTKSSKLALIGTKFENRYFGWPMKNAKSAGKEVLGAMKAVGRVVGQAVGNVQSGSFDWKVALPGVARVVGTHGGSEFADRTVVICCIPKGYGMDPSKSLQIRVNIKDRLRSTGIEGDVDSVVYPVSTKDVGLARTEILDAAVVTFSSRICANKYACLKKQYHVLSESSQKNFPYPLHPFLTNTPRLCVIVTRDCDRVFIQIQIQKRFSVHINVERGFTDAFICKVNGEKSQEAVDEIGRLQAIKPVVFLEFSASFQRFKELQEFIEQLENNPTGVDLAIYPEPHQGLWMIGDQAKTCAPKLSNVFPDLAADQATKMPEKEVPVLVMIMDPGLSKYIKLIEAEALAAISLSNDTNIQCNIIDSHGEFILKGQHAPQAEKDIGQLAEQCQHQLCTHDVPVTKPITNQEVKRMNTQFQGKKAVIEYDRARQCIHIIASKENAHRVRDEIARRYPPKQSSGSVPSGVGAGMPSMSAALVKSAGRSKFYTPEPASKPGPKHHSTHVQPKSLHVTMNAVTTAGNLPCQMVIHAVGPNMRYYKHREHACYMDLEKTFRNVLKTAKEKQIWSIAMPALSSGAFGVPIESVAKSMAKAVIGFLQKEYTLVKEVIIVDISDKNISCIQKEFEMQIASSSVSASSGGGSSVSSFSSSSSRHSGPTRFDPPPAAATPRHPASISTSDPNLGISWDYDTPAYDDDYYGSSASGSSITGSSGSGVVADPGKSLMSTADDDDDDQCPICMDAFTDPKKLDCGHKFCQECIDSAFSHKSVCPICGEVYGVLTGSQPQGTMKNTTDFSRTLPGYLGCGVIVIDYHFPDGTQGPAHPEPGQRYKGTRRTAYLPDNSDGRKVLRLLRKAFDQKLTFTIGRSTTSGRDNIVTWNDIHHKTNIDGGPAKFGYPDPGYLQRVTEELAAKGVKE